MVIENVTGAEEILLQNVPLIIKNNFGWVITFVQAIGIIFIFYFVYVVINGVLRWKDRVRLKRIEEKVDRLGEKVEGLIKKKERKKK